MENIILYIEICISALSIAGCLLVILSYYRFEELRNPSGVLTLWLAMAGIGISLFSLIEKPDIGSPLCAFQGVIGIWFPLTVVYTTSIIAGFLYYLIYFPDNTVVGITFPYFIIAWILPLLISLIPLINNSYSREDSDMHCWIETEDGHIMHALVEQYCLFYASIWISILFNLYVYIKTSHKILDFLVR
jgi:hypothetical protein